MVIEIPRYNQQIGVSQQTAPQGNAPKPQEAAQGFNILEASQNIQRGFEKIAQVGDAIALKEQQIKLDNFTAKVKTDREAYLNELENDNDYAKFGDKFDKFNNTAEEQGIAALGEAGYNAWRRNGGGLLLDGIKLSTAQTQKTKQISATQAQLADTLSKNAKIAAQSADPKTAALYFADAKKQLDTAYLPQKEGELAVINAQQRLNLEDNFKKEFDGAAKDTITGMLAAGDIAGARDKAEQFKDYLDEGTYNRLNTNIGKTEVEYDIFNDPETAVNNLKNENKFKFLMPLERSNYIKKAETELKAREDTILDKNTQNIANVFENIYSRNPLAANDFYKNIINNRSEAIAKYGLNPQKLNTAVDFMEKVLNNPNSDFAIQNEYNYAAVKTKYNTFDLTTDFKVENKDLNNVESITSQIAEINGNLAEGRFDKHKNDAMEMVVNLRRALAKQVNDTPIVRDTTDKWFRSTLSEKIPGMIKQYAKERVRGGELTPEALGQIYEDVYKNAQARNINLRSITSKEEQAAVDLVAEVFASNISKDYMLRPGEANAIATDTNMLVDIGSAPARVGFPIGTKAGNMMRDAQSYPIREGIDTGRGMGKQLFTKLQGVKRQDLQKTPFGDISNPLKAKEALENKIKRTK